MRGFAAVSFSLVCFVSGSLWLLPMETGSQAVELVRLVLSGILAFTLILLVCLFRTAGGRPTTRPSWRLVLSGVGSIGAPTLLLWLGRHDLSSIMAVATQVSVPVVVAVATATIEEGSELQKPLISGLIGMAGAFLILPVALPGSFKGWTGLSCYLAAAGCSGIFSIVCHREMKRVSSKEALLTVTGANAIILGVFATVWLVLTASWRESLSGLTLAGLLPVAAVSLSMIGTIVLLRLLSPLALASRFIFIPLLAAAEAFFLMRPTLSVRTCFGALLMLLGGVACLRPVSEEDSAQAMSLR